MNLHSTIIKLLGYHITKENALKFADEQFGLLCSYIRNNPNPNGTVYDDVSKSGTILDINEDAILDGVLHELEGHAVITSKESDLFKGSVFAEILENLKSSEVPIAPKILTQLKELNKLFAYYNYVRITDKK